MNKKVNLYRLFIIILLLLTFVSAFFISFFYNFDSNKYIKKMNAHVAYTTNYKLLNKDKTTTFTSLNDLDKISVLFNYSMTLNVKSTIKDNYKIIGKLIISDDEKDLFIEDLLETDVFPTDTTGNVLNIKETKEINFNEDYVEYLKAIEDEYYKGKKARIDYVLVNDIKMYNSYLNKDISKNEDVILSIDLNNGTINPVNVNKNETIYGRIDINTCYAICLELLTSIILFSLIIILLLRNILSTKHSFDYRLERILRKYDKNIVNVKSFPRIDNKQITFVSSFKELLNASKESKCPINYLDIRNHHEATFIVMLSDLTYVYKLK